MNTSISRRGFLKATTLGAATAALSPALLSAAPAADFRLRYLTASSMYGTMRLEDILPEVRKTGAEEIDIWPKIHGDQREQIEAMGHEKFAELLAQHNLKMGVITQFKLGPMHLASELPVVKKFGGWLLIAGSKGNKDKKVDIKAGMKKFVEDMKPHVAAAEEQGVSIAIENHGSALLETADSIRWFLEFGTSKHLGLALAPYHLPQDAALIASLIEDAGDRLFLFYAWQHGKGSAGNLPKPDQVFQMPARGSLDFTPAMRALKKINYRNYTEPFMHASPRGTAIAETPAAVTAEINHARAYLEECLKKA